MQFSSGVFLMLFLPITMLVYRIAGVFGRKGKNLALLLASLLFYAWGEPVFVFVMFFGIIINYLLGLLIESKENNRVYLVISLVFNLGILFIFKYLSFVTRELSACISVRRINIGLPIGISFYTFQIMSYIFDVYRKRVPAQRNFLNLALYISMFPQLVAGPIVRYSDIENEINTRSESEDLFSHGTVRFVIGLAKKVLIADYLGGIADKIFVSAEYSYIPLLTAWIGAVAYTFEIYYDFSGYSDMAIGLGECFGFHFKENFKYPYISCSVSEFWRRWHISLTDWFRDYVYIPLGGNRVSPKRHIFNLFVVWLLTGVWHGAEWTFVIWGMMYFAILLFEKKTSIMHRIPRCIGHIITMFVITIGWVVFKASNTYQAKVYLQSMFGYKANIVDESAMLYLRSSLVIFFVSYIGCFPIYEKIREIIDGRNMAKRVYWIPVLLIFGLSLLVVINGSYSPFIYFNF